MTELIPWEPFRELWGIRDAFNRLFGHPFFRRFGEPMQWQKGGWFPPVDVYEKKDAIVVKAELPGVEKKDIKISLGEKTLTIKGETKREREVRKEDFFTRERVSGEFLRTIPLPVAVKKEGIKANYKDGVLEIILPKVEGDKHGETEIKIE